MENVFPVAVINSPAKLENDEKFDQVDTIYLKEKMLNDVRQHFSPSNQGEKINAESVKNLREKIENLHMFFTR